MELLKSFQIGPDGQCSTLERLSIGIHYIELYNKVQNPKNLNNAKEGLICWKKLLRKERLKKSVINMEKLSEKSLNIDEINDILDNKSMWNQYDEIIRRAKNRKCNMDEAKLNMAVIMVSVKLASMQRPGAVTNCLLQEYQDAIIERGVQIIKVANHKTGAYGTAKLTTSHKMTERLADYVNFIRPILRKDDDPEEYLFLNTNGKRISKIGNVEYYLRDKLKINIPTSTKARKIGATEASKSLNYEQNEMIWPIQWLFTIKIIKQEKGPTKPPRPTK